jgi:hypothetical protein
MNDADIYIKVEKKIINGDELCETSFSGDMLSLSSLVFSAMLSNSKFATIIVDATKSYIIENTDKKAILN